MDYVFEPAEDISNEEIVEHKVTNDDLQSYITYLKALTQEYTSNIMAENLTANYKHKEFYNYLLSRHLNIWEVKDNKDIINFKDKEEFIKFINTHNIRDIFIHKEAMLATDYVIYNDAKELQSEIDIYDEEGDLSELHAIVISGGLLFETEENMIRDVINEYKSSIEKFISKQHKSISMYVEFEGCAYGITFRTDDNDLCKLRQEFYSLLLDYINYKCSGIIGYMMDILDRANEELEELKEFLSKDPLYRKCTNKMMRDSYRIQEYAFKNNKDKFINLRYVLRNSMNFDKTLYSDICKIERIYIDTFEDVRRAIRLGEI